MPTEVKAFKCDFCPAKKMTYRQREEAIVIHEKKCFFNPANHACVTCINFVDRIRTEDSPLGEQMTIERKYCAVRKMFLDRLASRCSDWRARAGANN